MHHPLGEKGLHCLRNFKKNSGLEDYIGKAEVTILKNPETWHFILSTLHNSRRGSPSFSFEKMSWKSLQHDTGYLWTVYICYKSSLLKFHAFCSACFEITWISPKIGVYLPNWLFFRLRRPWFYRNYGRKFPFLTLKYLRYGSGAVIVRTLRCGSLHFHGSTLKFMMLWFSSMNLGFLEFFSEIWKSLQ